MQINKKDIIRFKKGLKVEFTELGWLVKHEGRKLPLNHASLIILDIFSKWISIEEGTKLMAEKCNHKNNFIGISSNFHELLKLGFFEFKQSEKNTFGFHNGKFDSFPVHIRMLNDKCRTLAFQKAIKEIVSKDDVVLDIGTGNGILAVTAALCGAKHVYAIERTEFIEVARAVFKANNVEDKITLINGDSTAIELPEKATVLVSEIIGNDPFNEGILNTFHDAKVRLLTSDAKIIPSNIKIFAIAAECEEKKYNQQYLSSQNINNWKSWYGVDFGSFLHFYNSDEVQKLTINSRQAKNWKMLSDAIELCHVDFSTDGNSVEDKFCDLIITENGTFSSVVVFFEAQLSADTKLSLHPAQVDDSNHWQSQLFIKKEENVNVGDHFELKFQLKKLKSHITIVRKPIL